MGTYEQMGVEAGAMVDALLADAKAAEGPAPLELDRFWRDQETAAADPFGNHIPQCALGAILTWECVFDELGVAAAKPPVHDDCQLLALQFCSDARSHRVRGHASLLPELVDRDVGVKVGQIQQLPSALRELGQLGL